MYTKKDTLTVWMAHTLKKVNQRCQLSPTSPSLLISGVVCVREGETDFLVYYTTCCTSDLFGPSGAVRRFPKLEHASEPLGGHVKTQITRSRAQFPDSVGMTCDREFLSLTKFQVITMLPLLPEHLENHCSKISPL